MDHLPECDCRICPATGEGPCDSDAIWRECTHVSPVGDPCGARCICDRLRACEQRIGNRIVLSYSEHIYEDGFAAGVQACRDAVEDRRVPWPTATGDLVNEGIDDALAAINGLRP